MKGALGLIAIAVVVYIFWITAVVIKRTKNKDKKD